MPFSAASEQQATWVTEYCAEGSFAFSLQYTEKCVEEQTPFQKIAVYKTQGMGHVMLIDGFIQLTQKDNFLYHEMMAHPVLFTHAAPKNVVIIGGGDCGVLQQVLKHDSVEQATQIDIDERVTHHAKQYFPELCANNHDPRASLLFQDGIQWMAEQPAGSIDAIIVDSTDPIGPAKGLFNQAFYACCINALTEQGVIVQQSESPLLHTDSIINPMKSAMRKAGFNHTQTVFFPQPTYPSGWWTATMASKTVDLTTPREQAIRTRNFKTRYYNEAIHMGALAMPEFMRTSQG